jgi:hypothetical protein
MQLPEDFKNFLGINQATIPMCIIRMAKDLPISPDLPAPATKTFFDSRIPLTSFSASSSAIKSTERFSSFMNSAKY